MEPVVKRNFIEQRARKFAQAMIVQHNVKTTPCVLYWRNLVIEVYPHKADEWRRDSIEVRKDLNKHFNLIKEILKTEGVFSVKVNDNIKRLVGHGEMPSRDEIRNDTFYGDCIPAAHRAAIGIACFPRNTSEDHPLVAATTKRRGSEAANRFVNQIDNVAELRDNGILSKDVATRIGGSMAQRAMPAMQMHPDSQPLKLENHELF